MDHRLSDDMRFRMINIPTATGRLRFARIWIDACTPRNRIIHHAVDVNIRIDIVLRISGRFIGGHDSFSGKRINVRQSDLDILHQPDDRPCIILTFVAQIRFTIEAKFDRGEIIVLIFRDLHHSIRGNRRNIKTLNRISVVFRSIQEIPAARLFGCGELARQKEYALFRSNSGKRLRAARKTIFHFDSDDRIMNKIATVAVVIYEKSQMTNIIRVAGTQPFFLVAVIISIFQARPVEIRVDLIL